MSEKFDETMMFEPPKDKKVEVKEALFSVYASLKEKGYNPIDQIIGYLLSGDPAYITSHNNARSLIRKFERDELLEEILKAYLKCDEE